ncbi:hypothetical protein LUZ60_010987 [Juncus effusus]|nr:hypothetical protein LUZ60_010987 [Juncus effusus]
MDPGNNNNLKTEVKANFLPYSKDLPKHIPTGRFCNGKLTPDFIAQTLNLSDNLPAYAGHVVTANDTGVSFASSGSGLDDWTAKSWNVTTMSDQIQQFVEYIGKLKALKGEAETLDFIKKSVYIISVGSNDMMLDYYLIPLRSAMYTLPQFHDFLLGRLKTFLQQLHALGVRNFAMTGLPPLGCVPIQMSLEAVKSGPITLIPKILKPTCVSEKNDDATRYNIKLQRMLEDLQKQFNVIEKSKVVYIDIYTPLFDMATNPAKYGFKETTRGCCGTVKKIGHKYTSSLHASHKPPHSKPKIKKTKNKKKDKKNIFFPKKKKK